MKKLVLLALLASCLSVGEALATITLSPRVAPAGSDRLQFQKDLLPTSAFTAMTDSWIDGNNTSTNHGADSLLVFGDGGGSQILIYFDLSAWIPATAVIARAVLHLYAASETVASSNADFQVETFRVWMPWVEAEVTYDNYSTGNAWGVAGANDITITAPAGLFGAAGVTAIMTRVSQANTGWTRSNKAGIDIPFGADSILTASDNDVSSLTGELIDPDNTAAANIDVPRWWTINITDFVANVQYGAWENHGIKIAENFGTAGTVTFKSTEAGWKGTRPWIEVWYRDANEVEPDTVLIGQGSGGTTLGADN